MGNSVSSGSNRTAAVGIDNYVAELRDVRYEKSLGHGRFMRTIRCRTITEGAQAKCSVHQVQDTEAPVVVKVFVKTDPHLSLSRYKRSLRLQTNRIADVPNILPYSRIVETERAAYLIRQYLYTNLYDRISTRPFLASYDKKWIVYQLLVAIHAAHSVDVTHGDIKTENILVTSWNWIYITDFSGYKPTYLPEDNPADFYFFFDTSGRRSCYVAPERFTGKSTIIANSQSAIGSNNEPTPVSYITQGNSYQNVSTSLESVPQSESLDFETRSNISFNNSNNKDVNAEYSSTASSINNTQRTGNRLSTSNNKSSYSQTPPKQNNFVNINSDSKQTPHPVPKHRRNQSSTSDIFGNEPHGISPAMDIFSLGCTIAEIFLEGAPLFTFSQLMQYRQGEYYPSQALQTIEDEGIRNLVKSMISINPMDRADAEYYLNTLRGTVFPEEFYTILHPYLSHLEDRNLKKFTNPFSGTTADTRIERITKTITEVVTELRALDYSDKAQCTVDCYEDCKVDHRGKQLIPGFLVLSGIVCSSIRNVLYPSSKLNALNILVGLAKEMHDEIKLDRILPYCVHLLEDSNATVRAVACESLTDIIQNIDRLPVSEANIFLDYVNPLIGRLRQDEELFVRAIYGDCLPILGSKAIGLLSKELEILGNDFESFSKNQKETFDIFSKSIKSTQEAFQNLIVFVLTDDDVIVKQSLLKKLPKLCYIFGPTKVTDVLLLHIIAYLNEGNWQLRCNFFESIKESGAILGKLCIKDYINPLSISFLADANEPVITSVLECLSALIDEDLIEESFIKEQIPVITPMVCHPTKWIRYGAIGFIVSAANRLSRLDILCLVYPTLQPFLKYEICNLTTNDILENLLPPISRDLFDQIINFAVTHPNLGRHEFSHMLYQVRPDFDTNDKNIVVPQALLSEFLTKIHAVNISESNRLKIFALHDFIVQYVFKTLMLKSQVQIKGKNDFDTIIDSAEGKGKSIMLQNVGIHPHNVFLMPFRPDDLTYDDIRYLSGDDDAHVVYPHRKLGYPGINGLLNDTGNYGHGMNNESYVNQIAKSVRSNRDSIASFDLSPTSIHILDEASLQNNKNSKNSELAQNLFKTNEKSNNLIVVPPSNQSSFHRSMSMSAGQSPLASADQLKYDANVSSRMTVYTGRARHRHHLSMGSAPLSPLDALDANSRAVNIRDARGLRTSLPKGGKLQGGVSTPSIITSTSLDVNTDASGISISSNASQNGSETANGGSPANNVANASNLNNADLVSGNTSQLSFKASTSNPNLYQKSRLTYSINDRKGSVSSRASSVQTNLKNIYPGTVQQRRPQTSNIVSELNDENKDPNIARLILKKTFEYFPPPIEEFGPKVHAPSAASIMLNRVKSLAGNVSTVDKADMRQWAPEGISIAHLAEHTGRINQLELSLDQNFFATCSEDKTVKIWDTQRIEKNAVNHSRLSYYGHNCEVTSLSFCEGTHSIASAGVDGSIHINRITYIPPEGNKMAKYGGSSTVRSMRVEKGHVTYIRHFETESQSILLYATSTGEICGVDLRSMERVWEFFVPGHYGIVTAISVDPKRIFMVIGTHRGIFVVYDMRFGLQVKSFMHPSGAKIISIDPAPSNIDLEYPSILVSTETQFNEVSLWDVNTGECKQAWCTLPLEYETAQESPDLASYFGHRFQSEKVPDKHDFVEKSALSRIVSNDSHGKLSCSDVWGSTVQCIDAGSDLDFFVTGGTDRVVRYWDYKSNKCATLSNGITKEVDILEQQTAYIDNTKINYVFGPSRNGLQENGSMSTSTKKSGSQESHSQRSSTATSSRRESPSKGDSTKKSGSNGNSAMTKSVFGLSGGNILWSSGAPTRYYTFNDASYMHKSTINNIKTSHLPFTMMISTSTDGVIKCWR